MLLLCKTFLHYMAHIQCRSEVFNNPRNLNFNVFQEFCFYRNILNGLFEILENHYKKSITLITFVFLLLLLLPVFHRVTKIVMVSKRSTLRNYVQAEPCIPVCKLVIVFAIYSHISQLFSVICVRFSFHESKLHFTEISIHCVNTQENI